MLIDTHCHLEMKPFNQDRSAVIRRANQAGVQRILTVGTNTAYSQKAVVLAEEFEPVYAAVGIHPHDAKDASPADYQVLRELAARDKVVAYGEIGLDFFKNYSPRAEQLREFGRQIRIARELDLPLIIHDRDAHRETLEVLRQEGGPYRGVFHCFAGDEEMARQAFELGFLLSFTGSITFAKQGKETTAHRVIRQCPLDRLMVETDAPFLTPHPLRGKRNEPAYVRFVAEKIAELKGIKPEEIARQTSGNAYRLFRFETKGLRPAIAYAHKNGLYINLTSRCSNSCTFCSKQPDFLLGPHYLRLEPNQEPTVAEVLDAVGDPRAQREIVFCGYGEPACRWDDMIAIAKELKKRGAPRIRLNTNGQADLLQKRAVAKEMKGAIDAVNVSLNAADAATYQRLCRSRFGDAAFPAVVDFIGQAKRYVPEVVASVVEVLGLDLGQIKRYVEDILGVKLRVR